MDNKFTQWIRRILDTRADEIDCSTCLEQVSQYVDLELAGKDAAARLPEVKHHLDQCKVCDEEYHVLRELARMERDHRLPANDDLANRLKGES